MASIERTENQRRRGDWAVLHLTRHSSSISCANCIMLRVTLPVDSASRSALVLDVRKYICSHLGMAAGASWHLQRFRELVRTYSVLKHPVRPSNLPIHVRLSLISEACRTCNGSGLRAAAAAGFIPGRSGNIKSAMLMGEEEHSRSSAVICKKLAPSSDAETTSTGKPKVSIAVIVDLRLLPYTSVPCHPRLHP